MFAHDFTTVYNKRKISLSEMPVRYTYRYWRLLESDSSDEEDLLLLTDDIRCLVNFDIHELVNQSEFYRNITDDELRVRFRLNSNYRRAVESGNLSIQHYYLRTERLLIIVRRIVRFLLRQRDLVNRLATYHYGAFVPASPPAGSESESNGTATGTGVTDPQPSDSRSD